jgi:hypothetical protein
MKLKKYVIIYTIILNMGNQSPDYYKVTEPLDARWQEVVLTPSQADSLNFVLIQNIETKE